MDGEVDAWNTGKIISDLLGVDEIVYDDIMKVGINGHYSSEFNFLATQIKEFCPLAIIFSCKYPL